MSLSSRYYQVSVVFGFMVMEVMVVLAVEQEMEMYTGIDQGGTGLLIRDKITNLQALAPNIINNVQSFCIQGRWRIFPKPDFAFDDLADVLAFSTKSVKCHNSPLGNTTGSARYLGSSDTEGVSIAFYSDDNQLGSEVVVEVAELAELPFRPRSLITTGESSWTVWTGKNFEGRTTCYNSTKRVTVLNSNLNQNIGSVKEGCDGAAQETVILDDAKSAITDLIQQAIDRRRAAATK